MLHVRVKTRKSKGSDALSGGEEKHSIVEIMVSIHAVVYNTILDLKKKLRNFFLETNK